MLHGGGATGYFKDTEVSVKLMPRKSHAPQVTAAFSREQSCHSNAFHPFALFRGFAYLICFLLSSFASTSALCTAAYSKRAFQNAYTVNSVCKDTQCKDNGIGNQSLHSDCSGPSEQGQFDVRTISWYTKQSLQETSLCTINPLGSTCSGSKRILLLTGHREDSAGAVWVCPPPENNAGGSGLAGAAFPYCLYG